MRWLYRCASVMALVVVAPLQAQENPDLAALDEFLSEADRAINEQDYLTAREHLREALSIKPTDGTARGFIGFVQTELDKKASFLFARAHEQFANGQYQDAWHSCRAVIELQDDDQDPYNVGCQRLAVQVWAALGADQPYNCELEDALGCLEKGCWRQARTKLDKIPESSSDPRYFLAKTEIKRLAQASARVQYKHALIHHKINDWADAKWACQRVFADVEPQNQYYRACQALVAKIDRQR